MEEDGSLLVLVVEEDGSLLVLVVEEEGVLSAEEEETATVAAVVAVEEEEGALLVAALLVFTKGSSKSSVRRRLLFLTFIARTDFLLLFGIFEKLWKKLWKKKLWEKQHSGNSVHCGEGNENAANALLLYTLSSFVDRFGSWFTGVRQLAYTC